MKGNLIKFLKSKDFILKEELGRGACGKTVKLYDEIIDETFVCKKYEPYFEVHKETLFSNFLHEIKLLFLLNHKNIVRIFNYYIYPEKFTGYILMEYIQGTDIEKYLSDNPQNINDVFIQCIDGFRHLEKCNILHRDIRPMNIMVTNDGVLKIIDFGFGKRVDKKEDFDKSISLNWWCEPPLDFKDKLYDFRTEIYFIGKLFEKIIREDEIGSFKYGSLISGMCNQDPILRIQTFSEVSGKINEGLFFETEFKENELLSYREFSTYLHISISKIESNSKYHDDPEKIQKNLESCYRNVMLEEFIPQTTQILNCFISGQYYFSKTSFFPVHALKQFVELLRSCSKDKKIIITSNIFSKLDSIRRYAPEPPSFDDEIPF